LGVFDELSRELRQSGKLTLSVKVTPKSAKTEVAGVMADGTLRIKVAAVPEEGKANAELCRYLAKRFGVSNSSVRVDGGHISRHKRVVVES
jgi:uncharacterized protein